MTMTVETMNSSGLPAPGGHYSHVAVAGSLAFVSGQLPLDAQGRPAADASFEEQAKLVLGNLDHCLARAGVTRNNLVQVRVYVARIADWPAFDGVYADWIGPWRPARTVVATPELHFGVALEVDAVAAISGH